MCCGLLSISDISIAQTVNNNLSISEYAAANSFPIFSNATTPTLYYDANDAKVVKIAAEAFAGDINLISGKQVNLNKSNTINGEYAIIAGTIGHSKLIDDLIKQKLVDVKSIKNKWEIFDIQVITINPYLVKVPFKAALVIAGSDRRGTAYGLFHLSRMMGISPFVWWADVLPTKRDQLFVSGDYTSNEPSVQYRGIFINDEDWGLQPWAAKKMDTAIKDIGPKTYAKVFELLLRLKANYIWPAMHPCTKAFYYYKENPKVADDYAIVVGSSHAEPMLRNNVFEWAVNFENEYGKQPGEWRYDTNKDIIHNYWNDRVKQAANYESVFTVGMRGVHDSGMPGPKEPAGKLKLLEQIITDQREMLQNNLKRSPDKIPQIFVPYKEVLGLYRMGMKLPDDITIIWPDDNHGYIRQLPDATEQKRSGGHGVYYHLSYWGSPADYLWLSSISPALIGYEMKKAYDYNARKLWVFNVGDIKPAELEIQFALDMAWDITVYNAANPSDYINKWAYENFKHAATPVSKVKDVYYALAQSGKPEHLHLIRSTPKRINNRLEAIQMLEDMLDQCSSQIDQNSADAFFQLVKYPVQATILQNKKILHQQLAIDAFNKNNFAEAKHNLQVAQTAFLVIKELTERYNRFIAKGKWNGIMSWHPRDQKAFDAPLTFDSLRTVTDSAQAKIVTKEAQLVQSLKIYNPGNFPGCRLLPGLGVSNIGITPLLDNTKSIITCQTNLNAGVYHIVVKCLPTFAMEKERQLNYSISLNGDAIQTVNVNAEAESPQWKENVIRGFSSGETVHVLKKSGMSTIIIQLLNKNLVINQVDIYKAE